MAQVSLRAETGRATGTRASRRLRRTGQVPAVVYGQGMEPVSVMLDHHDLNVAFHGEAGTHVVINLEIDGAAGVPTLIRSIDRHPIRNQIRHVDLLRVSLTEKVTATVALHFEGVAVGMKAGGILTPARNEVHVEGLPTDIPAHISVDVSALEIGDTMRIGELPEVEGITYLDPPEEGVVGVTVPAVEKEPEAPEAEAEAEEGAEAAPAEEAGEEPTE
jgi:large subunit ribosomal protein L25